MSVPAHYILLGGPEHLDFFTERARYEGEQWFWTWPQSAQPGDYGHVYLTAPVSRVVGRVTLVAPPFYNVAMLEGEKVKDKWVGEVGEVVCYNARRELTMAGLRALFPDWPWLRYPRGKTVIPPDVLRPFLTLVKRGRCQSP